MKTRTFTVVLRVETWPVGDECRLVGSRGFPRGGLVCVFIFLVKYGGRGVGHPAVGAKA